MMGRHLQGMKELGVARLRVSWRLDPGEFFSNFERPKRKCPVPKIHVDSTAGPHSKSPAGASSAIVYMQWV